MHITKMHGLGNDFIVLEAREIKGIDLSLLARRLCARRLGVGADGLLVACPSQTADIKMRIINADGSEAEMCGNGIRCFARFVYEKGMVPHTEMTIETLAGVMRPQLLLEDGHVRAVRVNMGKPSFESGGIPVLTEHPMDFEVKTPAGTVRASSVLMGVPHTIVVVEDVSRVDIEALGPAIERHPLFPRGTNVDFVQVLSDGRARMETWERGAGHTLACGTGATAAGIVLWKKGLSGSQTDVQIAAGTLRIENMPDGTAFMTGPAEYVFCGVTQ